MSAPRIAKGNGWLWRRDDSEPTMSYDCESDDESRSVYINGRMLVIDSLGDSVWIPLSAVRALLEEHDVKKAQKR